LPKGKGKATGTRIYKRLGRGGPGGARVTVPMRGPSARSHRGGGRWEGDELEGWESWCAADESSSDTPAIPTAAALGNGGSRRGVVRGKHHNGRDCRRWIRRRAGRRRQAGRSRG